MFSAGYHTQFHFHSSLTVYIKMERIAIADSQPICPEQFDKIMAAISEGVRHGAVLIHCVCGISRAPVLCAAWMARCGYANIDKPWLRSRACDLSSNHLPFGCQVSGGYSMKKAAIYARILTPDQQLENQIPDL